MKTIFVVDDQADIRRMLEMSLRAHFNLAFAASADEAFERLDEVRPDGMVLDIMMPGRLDGLQLCEYIKAAPEWAAIHVVLLSARAQVADQELGLAIGADAYFIKPFSPRSLANHLCGAFGIAKT